MAEQPLKITGGAVAEFAYTDVAFVGGVLAATSTGVNAPGNDLTVIGGAATPAGTGAGGDVAITGGAAGTTASALAGGDVVITGGATSGTGVGAVPGAVTLSTTRTSTNTAAVADGPVLTLTQPALTASVFVGTADPSASSGVVANAGSVYLRKNGTAGEVWVKSGAGNTVWNGIVAGPASATDNAIARYDLTTGKLIQNSSATVDDNGYIDNAQGRFNGVRYYNSSATDPSSPTPADGDIYWNTALEKEMRYDGTRSKWLSVESATFLFNSPQVVTNSYFKLGDVTMTSTRGYTMPHNATLVAMGITRSNALAATLAATVGGSSIATLPFSPATAKKAKDNAVNADIAVDAVLSARNTGANEILNGIGYFVVKWRV